MRLTSFTDYGLRMLMRMARAPERVFSTGEMAEELGLPRNHLAKIVQKLAQMGIVETRRGGGGGAILARSPDQISLGDIIRRLEDGQALVDCLATGGERDCSIDGKCRLKFRLIAAERAFYADLDKTSLASIAL
ncbi:MULTISPECIES: RrF2 family transcriptional regulator [unclassified Novosphingobium]|uniref:RrF2 family transcriptional regulator n=1 Tax=unclassified Novosphingobium TaxID=2644732 RepID=UPI00086E6B36|nr:MULTISPECIES: Rrf2 family transcriptional regulator [unclassified Novosphingobium]MDR6707507.1 Rrf2 family nitric oxide-sensitive transcriptional repressor [Novosphingobium sp. 1748]ODU81038.1 MAG: Rrf2 family transcriptional regulator [Novosphingobium sp. SCN 63-17]OJX96310.1 MAG: Rrf2 family transcriptional regulator [Novosphingobium sp. 63-713]